MANSNNEIMMYSEVSELLGINTQSVSQFIGKHKIRKGKIVRKGRKMAVVDRKQLMNKVNELNYTGPIDPNSVEWEDS